MTRPGTEPRSPGPLANTHLAKNVQILMIQPSTDLSSIRSAKVFLINEMALNKCASCEDRISTIFIRHYF